MKFDPQKHHRRSIRLQNYDYDQPGGYFITIVTYHRDLLFGEIADENMQLSDFGKIVDECWRAIPEHFPNVELGAHVVMPNHIHGIIIIQEGRARYIVPLRNNSRNPYQVLYRQSSEHSRLPLPVISSANTMPPASGKEIITST